MARGVNKVILIGNLGQDPEVRFLPSGAPVANLRLATTDAWVDKQSGQKQERTEWHTLVLFNRLAEIAQQYLQKGARIYVEGRLQTRKWQGQDGQDRYSTDIVVNDLQMLSGPSSGQGGAPQGGSPHGNYGGPPQGGAPQGGRQPNSYRDARQGNAPAQGPVNPPVPGNAPPQQGGNYGAPDPGSFSDFDDEIPF